MKYSKASRRKAVKFVSPARQRWVKWEEKASPSGAKAVLRHTLEECDQRVD